MEQSGACGFMAIAHHVFNDENRWHKDGLLQRLQTELKAEGDKITKANAKILKMCTKCLKDNAVVSCKASQAEFRLTDHIRESDFLIFFYPYFDIFMFDSGYF